MAIALSYRETMGDLDRLVPSGIIEQWVYHLRRQRSRATDAIWLIDQGFTLHDGMDGVPQNDATARWRAEQVAEMPNAEPPQSSALQHTGWLMRESYRDTN